jgi:hypothetical protein
MSAVDESNLLFFFEIRMNGFDSTQTVLCAVEYLSVIAQQLYWTFFRGHQLGGRIDVGVWSAYAFVTVESQ